jgi:hypothetical protein
MTTEARIEMPFMTAMKHERVPSLHLTPAAGSVAESTKLLL